MRLTSLRVTDFGCVRGANVRFGPGLNVLFGPNDLGKSSLAEAIRSALLLQHGSAYSDRFAPWRSDATPLVELVFQTEPQRFWRIRKTFGSGSRGSSVFESSKDGHSFSVDAKARAVDAEIRKHLCWGIPEPGGRGGQRGLPDSFLTTVLLARQDGVTELFGRSLAADGDESGRKRIAEALQAAAQDPLFAKVVEQAQVRVDEAFTPTGRYRTGRSSPLTQVKDQLDAAEREFKELESRVLDSQATRDQVRELAEEIVFEEAERDIAKVALQQIDEVLAKQREMARAEAEMSRIEGLRGSAELAAQATETAKREVVRHDEVLQEAKRASEAAAEAFAKAQAEVDRLESGVAAQARLAMRAALEKALIESQATLADVGRRIERARSVGELGARANELRSDSAAADDVAALLELERGNARRNSEQFGPLLSTRRDLERAVGEVARIEQVRHAADVAQAAHNAATSELPRLDEGLERARHELRGVEEQLVGAQAEVERLEGGETAQARVARHSRLERDIIEKQSALEHVQRSAERASQVGELDKRAAMARELADETRVRADSLAEDAATQVNALADLERQLHAMRGIGLWLQRDELVERAARALAASKEKESLEAELSIAEAKARELQEVVDGSRLPTQERLAELEAVERELQASAARVDIPLAIEVEALDALDVAVDGGRRSIPQGETTALTAAGELAFELVGLARIRIRGGESDLRERLDQARFQFESTVAPTLVESGSRDLNELRQAVVAMSATGAQLNDARTRVEVLMGRLRAFDGSFDSPESLAVRINVLDENLTGYPVQLLKERAAGLGPGARTEVEASIALLERKVADAQKSHQSADSDVAVESSKLQVLLNAAKQADDIRDEAAMDLSEPWAELLQSSRRKIDELDAEIRDRQSELARFNEGEESTLKEARERVERMRKERESTKATLARAEQEHRSHTKQVDELAGVARVRCENAEAEDHAAAVAQRDALRLDLAALPRPTTAAVDADIGELEQLAAQAREVYESVDASASAARSTALVAGSSAEQARAAFDRAESELGAPWKDLLESAKRQDAEVSALVDSQRVELERFASGEEEKVQDARGQHAEHTRRLAEARQQVEGLEEAQRGRTKTLDGLVGEARVRREAAEAEDRDAASSALESLVQEHHALPLPQGVREVAMEVRDAAARRLAEAERRVGEIRTKLHTAEGALAQVGGEVVRERREGALAALNRFRDVERSLEVDYNAWRLLLTTLKEAERSQATHLGQSMVEPVAKRFAELTASRYGELNLGPELEVGGIEAFGGTRDIEQLSVGTREQLSTVFRLSLAEQLESAVLLDDQLTQTDPGRMNWFKQRLREFAGKIQIIVITCRPQDYLQDDEVPVAGQSYDGENVRALNLELVIERGA